MERHHESALSDALDKLYLEGAISIPWYRVYLWFNATRLSKSAYREILARWEDLCTEKHGYDTAPELYVIDAKGRHSLNIRREMFESEEALVPLSNWT